LYTRDPVKNRLLPATKASSVWNYRKNAGAYNKWQHKEEIDGKPDSTSPYAVRPNTRKVYLVVNESKSARAEYASTFHHEYYELERLLSLFDKECRR
jgi:hypothetical protein